MTEHQEAHVHCTIDEGICELVLDNPGRSNALSLVLLDDLAAQLEIARQEKARVVIISGAGSTFSAGADLADLTGTIEDLAMDEAIEKVVDAMLELPAPVIAAVEGPCMGGAVDVALACDLLVAGADAFFEVPATRMGLLYNPRAILRWRNRLSGLTLRSMLLTGERLAADAAFQAGIASHVVAAGSALDKSRELASQVLAGTRDAVAATKDVLVAFESGDTNLENWQMLRGATLASPERKELVDRARKSKLS
ncbi:MAG: enoyl-CoA hydratase/isomerase family protein [Proteobacteria bacterium]|nr:enoyl-CoA hydratase/isomerase family protein [Pseudomonadota bacterium]